MSRNNRESNALPITVLALLIIGLAVVVGIINDPGPLPPAPARSLEERDAMDAATEAARRDLEGAGKKAPVLKPDAPAQFRESVKKARERLNGAP